MKTLIFLLMLAPGLALAGDVGMLTRIKGPVSVDNQPATAFMKLRHGDTLVLAAGADAQLLYTGNGRQESWIGPARIAVGERESTAMEKSSEPAIRQLPTRALAHLARAPNVLYEIKSRTGMSIVRSASLYGQVIEADDIYRQMKAATDENDVAPELYLVSALYELKLYKDVQGLLEDILRKQPDNAEARALVEHVNTLMAPR